MTPRSWLFLPLAAAILAAGCGREPAGEAGHGHSESDGIEAAGSVTFKLGRGLRLVPEVITALGVRTAEAEERTLAAEHILTAQVFATTPRVLATALVAPALAGALPEAVFDGAELVRVDPTAAPATGFADAVFALISPPALQVGDFVRITARSRSSPRLAVPASAVLDSATGRFVYVVNGDAYLRTPVTTGAQADGAVEITDGLYAGDIVVTTPVDQLWLAELRLTRGGGHSH